MRNEKPENPERKNTRKVKSPYTPFHHAHRWEALVKYSLPLSPEIVATVIARYDNEGAARCGQGEGWDKKGREL